MDHKGFELTAEKKNEFSLDNIGEAEKGAIWVWGRTLLQDGIAVGGLLDT